MKLNAAANQQLIFITLLILVVVDRGISLYFFGFNYTDIDQTVMWNGALNYSKGLFHEPFFYGQNFNYMLEALISVPLLYFNVPVYIALPIATSFITLFPFVTLSYYFLKQKRIFAAYFLLCILLLLPVEFNFLTSLSRGWVQALLFVPLLYAPLFHLHNKKYYIQFVIGSSLCLTMNTSSILFILPLGVYYFLFNYKSKQLYISLLYAIPILALNYLAKYFYLIHPESIQHELVGINLSVDTFWGAIKQGGFYNYLFPFHESLGFIYFIIIFILLFVTVKLKLKKEFLSIFSLATLIFITLFIPKLQEFHAGTGIFFNSSRLYIILPLTLFIIGFFILNKTSIPKTSNLMLSILFVVTTSFFIYKNYTIQKKVEQSISSKFPIAKNSDLVSYSNELNQLVKNKDVDLIVHSTFNTYDYIFYSYTLNPITKSNAISICQDGDRRTWLYKKSSKAKKILLNGITVDTSKLNGITYELLPNNLVFIINNKNSVQELFEQIDVRFQIKSN